MKKRREGPATGAEEWEMVKLKEKGSKYRGLSKSSILHHLNERGDQGLTKKKAEVGRSAADETGNFKEDRDRSLAAVLG